MTPDLLVFVLDDVGVDKIGVYASVYDGGPAPSYLPATPNIDALASAGLTFTAAWATPTCAPTRSTMQTGLVPSETGIGWTDADLTELDLGYDTLAESLAPFGYRAGFFGKWGLGHASTPVIDATVPGLYRGDPNAVEQGYVRYVGTVDNSLFNYTWWTRVSWPVEVRGMAWTAVASMRTYVTDDTFAQALRFAAGVPSSPSLTIVSLDAAHTDGGGDSPNQLEVDDLPAGTPCGGCSQPEIYQALVQDVDTRIGAFLRDLWAADPARVEGAMIVVIGDNGSPDFVLEGGFPASKATDRTTAGKGTIYESGIHVPLVVADGCAWVRAEVDPTSACSALLTDPGRTVDVPVTVADLSPTLVELGGGGATSTTWGRSVAACLSDASADCGDPSLVTRVVQSEQFVRAAGVTSGAARSGDLALRAGDYKLLGHEEGSGASACLRLEFYDLVGDPFEATNLYRGVGRVRYGQPEFDALLAELLAVPTSAGTGWWPGALCG